MKFTKLAVLIALMVGIGPTALAQSAWRSVAVPYYTPPAYVQGLQLGWYAPHALAFAKSAERLTQATNAYCAGGPLAAAREGWRDTLLAWDRLSTVAVGPLVERRTVRRIDFGPTRPELLARAIDSHPANEADMERVGSAAKGFPALEKLLWPAAAPKGSAACDFAVQVAADIGREADALAQAFAVVSRDEEPDEDKTIAAMSEAVNQWIGAIEGLRVQGFERPLRERQSRGTARVTLPRDASGNSVAERSARWQTLSAQAVFEGREAPAPGTGLVPLEPYLRGKGLNPLADRLVAATSKAERDLTAAHRNEPARMQAAARSLSELKALVEGEVAQALDIHAGFSEADGD